MLPQFPAISYGILPFKKTMEPAASHAATSIWPAADPKQLAAGGSDGTWGELWKTQGTPREKPWEKLLEMQVSMETR